MKKKILSFGVITVLIAMLFALTGCGDNQENTNNENGAKSKNSLASVVKVGDYVDYKTKLGESYSVEGQKSGLTATQTFETTGNEKWRVFSINDDGSVNLISEDALAPKNQKVYGIYGALGYLNFIDELNNICKIYGTGESAKEARSINLDDYYNMIGWDNLANYYGVNNNQEEIYKAMNSRYGNSGTKINSKSTNIPNLQGNNGYATRNEFDISSNVKVDFRDDMRTNALQYKTMSIYNNDTLVKELLGKNYYWLATTFEDYHNYGEEYDLDKVWGVYFATPDYEIGGKSLAFNVPNITGVTEAGAGIRPIVTLNANVENIGGNGTADDPYIIGK